jgi:very-short-patch-repair endonuclease
VDWFGMVARVAAAQHGLFTRVDVAAIGVPRGVLQRWTAAGRVERVGAGVYRVAGAPPTWEQRLLAAVLAGGAGVMASHRSAARLWGLLDDDVLEVTVPDLRRPRVRGAVVHRSADVAGAHAVRRRAVPVTSPLRMLVDLGAVVGAGVVEDVLDRALERRLVTIGGVERSLSELSGRGRAGAGVLRAVLRHRALGSDRPDSLLEPRMARLLRGASLPAPAFQHEVRDAGRFVARVDFAYPDVRLALEVDGWGSHSSPRAFQSDLARQNALVALGWTVLRFTWPDVVRRPAVVAADIRRVLWTLRTA